MLRRTRSYRLDFSMWQQVAPNHRPRVSLEEMNPKASSQPRTCRPTKPEPPPHRLSCRRTIAPGSTSERESPRQDGETGTITGYDERSRTAFGPDGRGQIVAPVPTSGAFR